MKKSLYTALGLAVALAVSAPVIASSANAAPAATTATTPDTTTTVKKAHKPVKKVHKMSAKKKAVKPAKFNCSCSCTIISASKRSDCSRHCAGRGKP